MNIQDTRTSTTSTPGRHRAGATPSPGVPGPRPAPWDRMPHPSAPLPYVGPPTPGVGNDGHGPFAADLDTDDPRPAGNPLATVACVLGVLGLAISLRPLVVGSMAMAWDTYLALALAVTALGLGIGGARRPVRRPVAVAGIVLSAAALVAVAVLPSL